MKKRLLCIFMIIVMIVPFVFASCGKSESDKMKEIILGGEDEAIDRAMTLSIWLPTDAITVKGQTADLSELSQSEKLTLSQEYPEVFDFLKRVDDVEDAINKLLISKNYYTNIDIVPVNNEYYEEALAARFAEIDEDSDPFQMNARGDSAEYENDVVTEQVGNNVLYNLLYRPVDKNQLDIFVIRDYGEYDGYEQYRSYIEKGYILPLNKTTEATSENPFPKTGYLNDSGAYASINKLIRTEFMNQMKVNDLIYAIPNNHLYASQKYVAIDKKTFNEHGAEFNLNLIKNFNDCVDYIEAIGALDDENIVPFYDNAQMPAFDLADLDLLTYGDSALNEICSDTSFVEFVTAYKTLNENGMIKSELAQGQTAAVTIFEGTSVEEINAMAKDYYLVPVGTHSVSSNETYSSMFAISTFTLDYNRSMKILNLLISDDEIVTMLQYGIENEDYTISTEIRDGEEVEVLKLNKDTAYIMNNLYTGSSYYTYPHAEAAIDDWDAVKDANLNADISKYVNINYFISSAKLTEEELLLIEMREELKALAIEAFDDISQMSLEEFLSFVEFAQGNNEINIDEKYASAYDFATNDNYSALISLYDEYLK